MSDNITVLRCHDNVRLAKLITRTESGLEVKGFDDARTFAWRQVTVGDLDDIHLMLEQLRGDPKSCVIRGEPMGHVGMQSIVNRRQHVGSDGTRPDWDHHALGRQWVAFDLDKVAQDSFRGDVPVPNEEQARAIVYQVRAEVMPPAFAKAACVYKLSSSAGLKSWDRVSMHLWFWLDRRVHDLSLREYCKAHGFDISFSKCVQPHYTADPVFEGMMDPLAGVRLGRLPGRAIVETPAELLDGDGWRARDQQRKDAARKDLEKAARAVMADIPTSRAATRAYALRALAGGCQDVLSAAEGTRHDQLIRVAYNLGGYCQPGFLDQSEVVQALTRTVEAVFPAGRQRDELRTVAEMVEGGARSPRDLSHIGRAKGKLSVVRPEPPEDDDDDGLEVIGATAVQPARKPKAKGLKWELTDRDGKPENVSENVEALLEFMGVTLRRNLMNHSTEWGGELTKTIPTSAMNAVMLANIIDAGQRFGFTRTQHLQAYLDKIEVKHAYHPVAEWATGTPWDGEDRVPMLLNTLGISPDLMAEHGALLHEQLLRWLIAGGKMLVGDHGVAAEGVLVLQGPQGTGKTRWVKALLGPNPNWIAEGVILDPADKDSVILATSTFIAELGELDATYRKSDIAALKAFLTRDKDIYRSPYAKRSETYPRRTIFAATVNPSQFLADDTGNRRFWVMPVGQCRSLDPSAYQQVWAQAIALGRRGERHWLDDASRQDAERLLERFRDISPWEDLFFESYYPPGPETDSVERATRFGVIRDAMRPDKSWTTADVKQFGKWLRGRYKCANHNGSAAFYVRRRD